MGNEPHGQSGRKTANGPLTITRVSAFATGAGYIFTFITSFLMGPSPIIGACTSSGNRITN